MRRIITAVVLAAFFSTAMAQVARPPSIPMPKPMPIEVIAADDIDLSPARRYADRGDARTLQQARAHADAGDAHTLDAATQHTAAQVVGLQREAFSGVAQAAALVPLDPRADGETTVNLGAASYGGQTALGLSLAHQSGRVTFTGGVGTSGSKRTLVRASLGWRF